MCNLFPHNSLVWLSLLGIIQTVGCGRVYRYKHRSFSLIVGDKQSSLEEGLKESVKERLIKKGYIYKQPSEPSDLQGILQFETSIGDKRYMSLHAILDIYNTSTAQKVWSASASASMRLQKINAESIEPLAGKLTHGFPYAFNMGGIGVVISGDLRIIEFSPESPAREAGLKINDLVIKVDDKEVKEYEECIAMLRGEANTRVKLCIKRGEQEQDIMVKRMPLQKMYASPSPVKEIKSENLEEEFRKRVLQQQ